MNMGNSSGCGYNGERDEIDGFVYYIPVSFISVLLCLAAVAVVCKQRLHKTLVYRLALYQVLSAMDFSIIWMIASLSYVFYTYKDRVVIDALLMGSSFIKLMFTVWISIHLFALAIFHKNLQRLERLYVVSSLLIPLAVTIVLLVINLTGCANNREEIIFIIIFAVLVIVSLVMVVMGTILCHRACRKRNALLSEYDKQHKKALREMLPLLLYPIFFLLLATPLFGVTVLDFEKPDYYNLKYSNYTMTETASIWFGIVAPFWSFTTSLLLISHFCVVKCISKKKVLQFRKRVVRQQYNTEEGLATINETTLLCQKSHTHFSAPTED